MAEDDLPEIVELEEAAAWRLRQVDATPDETQSAAAAKTLQALADDLRRLEHPALLQELRALCNWLGESDNISDYALRAQECRRRIGIDRHPASAEAYLRMLIQLAHESM